MKTALIIKQQIGPAAFALLGINSLVDLGNGLRFNIKGCRKINKVAIELNGKDLYDITFYKYNRRTGACPIIARCEDIFAESMHDVIEKHTGLYARF